MEEIIIITQPTVSESVTPRQQWLANFTQRIPGWLQSNLSSSNSNNRTDYALVVREHIVSSETDDHFTSQDIFFAVISLCVLLMMAIGLTKWILKRRSKLAGCYRGARTGYAEPEIFHDRQIVNYTAENVEIDDLLHEILPVADPPLANLPPADQQQQQ